MKKYLIYSLTLSALILFSCEKEPEFVSEKVGKWKMTEEFKEIYFCGELVDTLTTHPDITYEFLEDGTGTFTGPEGQKNLTWEVTGEDAVIDICIDNGNGIRNCRRVSVLESDENVQIWKYYSDQLSNDFRVRETYERI